METEVMGRVLTEATIENLEDEWAVRRGLINADNVRRIVVSDALVDSGARLLSLPTRMIRQLGLNKVGSRHVTTVPVPRKPIYTMLFASRSRTASARRMSLKCPTTCLCSSANCHWNISIS